MHREVLKRQHATCTPSRKLSPAKWERSLEMNDSTLNLRRMLAHVVLGLLLLFGQQNATQHWLSHAIEEIHAKAHGSPPPAHCDVCDGLAAFGAAIPGSAFAHLLAFQAELTALPTPAAIEPARAFATGYQSRAPPVLS